VGNDTIDGQTDPWFRLTSQDHLVLLAPGAAGSAVEDQAIAMLTFQTGAVSQAISLAFSFNSDYVTLLPGIPCTAP